VSYGRGEDGTWRPLCTPTPGTANQSLPPKAHLSIDSGTLNGTEPATLNLSTHLDGATSSLMCHIDFGDGFVSDSCNPGAHAMKVTGDYAITLHASDYCGKTMEQSLTGSIIPKPKISNSSIKYSSVLPMSLAACVPHSFSGARVTEFLPNPSGDETEGEWIELENTTDDPLPLCGWSIDDGIGGSKAYSLAKHQIPPHQYLLIPRKESGVALNNDADMVRLIVPKLGGGTGVLMSMAFVNAPTDQSFAIDGSGAWHWSTVPTPGSQNSFAPDKNLFLPSHVVISAAVPNPKGTR
jgi:hypothetical protein